MRRNSMHYTEILDELKIGTLSDILDMDRSISDALKGATENIDEFIDIKVPVVYFCYVARMAEIEQQEIALQRAKMAKLKKLVILAFMMALILAIIL